MYKISYTRKFDKSFDMCAKRGYDMKVIKEAMEILEEKGELPARYKTHKLTGEYKGCLECHLKPNWLLVWEKHDGELVMLMIDTGTHSDLFRKY